MLVVRCTYVCVCSVVTIAALGWRNAGVKKSQEKRNKIYAYIQPTYNAIQIITTNRLE